MSDPICNERGVPQSECPPFCPHDFGRLAWQVRHIESGATVACRDRAEAEAHVCESASGPWVAELTAAEIAGARP